MFGVIINGSSFASVKALGIYITNLLVKHWILLYLKVGEAILTGNFFANSNCWNV